METLYISIRRRKRLSAAILGSGTVANTPLEVCLGVGFDKGIDRTNSALGVTIARLRVVCCAGGAYPGVSLRTLRVIGGPSGRSKGRFAARQVVVKTSTRLRVCIFGWSYRDSPC